MQISIWRKIRKILTYGIIGYFALLVVAVLGKYSRQETVGLPDFVSPIMGFCLISYWKILELFNCEQTIKQILSPRWLKGARTFVLWVFVFGSCIVLVVANQLLFSRILNSHDWSLLSTILSYVVTALLFSLSIYSLIVYIPSSQYLSSKQIDVERKKSVANAMTLLTPMLGFPWLIVVYLVLSIANIQVEQWIIYITFFSIYAIVFALFIDFPYSIGAKEHKKRKLDRFGKERNRILDRIREMSNGDSSLLEKIALECEIARIDREKKEAESESIHPYKVVIPFASLFFAIFVALLIDFIKSVLGL
jgi:hypothetical protein